jgi:hypothetical protein
MATIHEAKKKFGAKYRNEDGFVGVGICHQNGREALRLYVDDARSPVAQRFLREGHFEGFPVEVKVTGKFGALSTEGIHS